MDDDFWFSDEESAFDDEPLAKRARTDTEGSVSPFERDDTSDDDAQSAGPGSATATLPRPTPAGPTDSEAQQRRLQALAAPDAVLNTGVQQVLRDFVHSGGSPDHAVERLVHSYTGAGDSCRLLLHWLAEVGEDPSTLVQQFFADTVQEHFDPQRADAVFEQRLSAPPWLDGMLEQPEWRRVLFRVGADHGQCTLLKYTVQRLLEAGLHTEQTASPKLAAAHLPLFTEAFSRRVRSLMAVENDALTCSAEFQAFLDLCLAAHHCYLYAQAVLVLLARDPTGPPAHATFFRRLLEELEAGAVQRGLGKIAMRTSYLRHVAALSGRSAAEKATQVQAALQPMLVMGATNPVDVGKLHRLYTAAAPPPAEYLQHADLLELLLTDLFHPTKAVPALHKPKYVFLLARACGTRTIRPPPPPSAATPTAHPEAALFASLSDDHVTEDTTGCEDIQRALETVTALIDSPAEDTVNAKAIRPHLQYAVVAMGAIKWVDRRFQALLPQLELTSNREAAVPALLRLLADVARTHPPHWPACGDLLVKHFELVSDSELESTARVAYLKMMLTGLLYLAKLGHVLPVLHRFAEWLRTRTLDMTLIRTFLYRLLSTSQPPYSPRFVAALVPIVLDPKVTEAISSSSLASSPVPHLVEFLQHVLRHPSTGPGLGPGQLARLRLLHSTLAVLPS